MAQNGDTPLLIAIARSMKTSVQTLISCKANANTPNSKVSPN